MNAEANPSSKDHAKSSRTYQNPLIVGIVLLVAGISVGMVQYKVPTIMTNLMGMFSMTAESASWLMSIFTLVAIFTAIPSGALAQRFSAKTMMIVASCIAILGSLIGAFAQVSAVLILSRAVEGVALTVLTTCAPIIVQQNVRPENIGTSMGIWGIWGCLGSGAAAIITPTIFENLGFAGVWFIFAGVAAAAAVLVLVVIRKPPSAPVAHDGAMEKPRYRELFNRNTGLFFVAFVIYQMLLLAVLSFVPTILQLQGFDQTFSGFISTAPMLISIVSSPLFGIISDKTRRCKPLVLIGMLTMGPCTFLMYTQTGWLLWVGVIIMGCLSVGAVAMFLTAFAKLLPRPELASIGMGVLVTFQGIGQFLGTFVVQMLLGPSLENWMFAGLVLMALGLIGTACLALCKMP